MAKLKSNFKYMLDAAPAITFRDGAAAAITADGNTAAIVLDEVGGYWNDGELAGSTFAVVINVADVETGVGDEAYTLNLVAGPVGFASSVVVGTVKVPSAGQYVILVDADTVRKSKPDAAALRFAVDVTGAAPSITFTAFIAGAIIR